MLSFSIFGLMYGSTSFSPLSHEAFILVIRTTRNRLKKQAIKKSQTALTQRHSVFNPVDLKNKFFTPRASPIRPFAAL
jgi:hypothetical protein